MTSDADRPELDGTLADRFLALCHRHGLRRYVDADLDAIPDADARFRFFGQIADWGGWIGGGGVPGCEPTQALADAGAFVAEFMALHDQASDRGRRKLGADLSSAFVQGFAPLVHQVRVAAWLRSEQYRPTIADTDVDAPAFDYLAERGATVVEIECKAVSVDKGRNVSAQAIQRFGELCRLILPVDLREADQRAALLIEVPGRFPTDAASHTAIAHACTTALRQGGEHHPLAEVRLTRLPDNFPARSEGQDRLMRWAEAVANRPWVHLVSLTAGSAELLLAVTSRRDDRVVWAIERSLRKAASRQFSQHRPALLAVMLEGVSGAYLAGLARDSALGESMSMLLAEQNLRHLRGVVFFPNDHVDPPGPLEPRGRPLLSFPSPRPSPFDTPDPHDLLGTARKPTAPEPVAQP